VLVLCLTYTEAKFVRDACTVEEDNNRTCRGIVATLLWPSVGVKPNTWKKVRIWSPPGLPNVQSSTKKPKTPRIEVFLVSLERS
jgi:hypothetical protein